MSVATQLAAEGEPLTLTNGHQVRIRYGMKSLMRLEDTFGGLKNIAVDTDGTKPIIGPLMDLLACGLLHEHDGQGAPLTREHLAELVDPKDFQRVLETAGKALSDAFPTLQAPAALAAPEAPTQAFPGPSGTTSAPSSTDAPITTSG
jgi:hypothetical protein